MHSACWQILHIQQMINHIEPGLCHRISTARRQSSHIYTGIDSRSGYCVSSFHIQRSGREGDCATRSDVHRRGGASEVRGGNQADCITAEADNAVHLYAYNNDE